MQLVHDILYTLSLRPDARTDRIDSRIHRIYGDLGAGARFTDDTLDLHGAAVNFRYLQLEKSLQEARMGPREDDLRSLRGLSDLEDIALDLIVRLEFFAFDLFCERQDPFHAAEVYKNGAGFIPFHYAGDHIAFTTGEFVIDGASLGFTQLLDHDLLGSLRCDTAEILRCHIDAEHVACFIAAVDLLCLFHRDLIDRIFRVLMDLVHDGLLFINFIFPGFTVERNRSLGIAAAFLFISGQKHHFQCIKYHISVNLFDLDQGFYCFQ